MAQSWKTKYEQAVRDLEAEQVRHEVTRQQLKAMTDWKDDVVAAHEHTIEGAQGLTKLWLDAEQDANKYARLLADQMVGTAAVEIDAS